MEAKKEMKDMNLLEAMEHIVALAKGSGLSDEFYNKAKEDICLIAEKLQLSKQQSVMLSLFIDKSDAETYSQATLQSFCNAQPFRLSSA